MALKSRAKPVAVGLRVQNRLDDRRGFVIDKPQSHDQRLRLVPVIVECSTRWELWPEHWLRILPLRQQFPFHGGDFRPPKGYPLYVK
jgi:hypothetical protein